MRITLHQLKVFERVSELGSATAAANDLNMTQPAVSNIIRQLEEYYECELVERVGRTLSITAYGKSLIASAKEIRNSFSEAKARIEVMKGGLVGNLNIAIVSTAKYFFPKILGMYKLEFPNVQFRLAVCKREEIILRLKQNVDDFVVMSHPPSMLPIDYVEFFDDELLIAAPIGHKYSNNSTLLPISKLRDESWIVREQGSGTRYATENIFNSLSFEPNVEMEISDTEGIKQAVIANLGISVLPFYSVRSELSQGLIGKISVKEFPQKHTWYLVKNKGKSFSAAAQSFSEYLEKISNQDL